MQYPCSFVVLVALMNTAGCPASENGLSALSLLFNLVSQGIQRWQSAWTPILVFI